MNLTAAIASGGDARTLVAAVRDRESRRQTLLVDIKALERGAGGADPAVVLAELRALLAYSRALLHNEAQKRAGC